jgi:hypothetical protein
VTLNVLEIMGGGKAAISMTRAAVPEPVAFDAVSVAVNDPVCVGVPEINPVELLTANPEGRLVASKPVGLFVAVMVY